MTARNHSQPSIDTSLRDERETENAPNNRVKHLLLNKRAGVYKLLTGDSSLVVDGRSVEALRRNAEERVSRRPAEAEYAASGYPSLTYRSSRTKKEKKKRRGSSGSASPDTGFASSWHPGQWDEKEEENEDTKTPHLIGGCDMRKSRAKSKTSSNGFSRSWSVGSTLWEEKQTTPEEGPPALRLSNCLSEGTDVDDLSLSSLLSEDEDRPSSSKDVCHGDSIDTLMSGGGSKAAPVKSITHQNKTVGHRRSGPYDFTQSDTSLLSSCSNMSMKSAPDPIILRKKSQPRHRCQEVNGAVTGIVKAPRYSRQTTDPTLASSDASNISCTSQPRANRTFQRMNSLPVNAMRWKSAAEPSDSGFYRRSYSSCESWVPKGVDFSANKEVYVYEK